jgi:hypothetical protein
MIRLWPPVADHGRLDTLLMPLMLLGFFCLQLDRGNIANVRF